MEDVIKRSGNTFGTNEAFILTQLSIVAVPTAAIIFLDIITNELPEVSTLKMPVLGLYFIDLNEMCTLSGN